MFRNKKKSDPSYIWAKVWSLMFKLPNKDSLFHQTGSMCQALWSEMLLRSAEAQVPRLAGMLWCKHGSFYLWNTHLHMHFGDQHSVQLTSHAESCLEVFGWFIKKEQKSGRRGWSQNWYLVTERKVLHLNLWGCNCPFVMNFSWILPAFGSLRSQTTPTSISSIAHSRHCSQYTQLKKFQVSLKASQRQLAQSLVVLWNLSFKTLNTIPSFQWCPRGSWIYSLYHLRDWNSHNVWIQHLHSYKKCFTAAGGSINQYRACTLEVSVRISLALTAQLWPSKVMPNNEQCHSTLQDNKANPTVLSNEKSGRLDTYQLSLTFKKHPTGKRKIIQPSY